MSNTYAVRVDDAGYVVDVPIGVPLGSPVLVHCGECGHSWIAAYLPLEVRKFALILSRAICPKCAATKIFMGLEIFMGLDNGHS